MSNKGSNVPATIAADPKTLVTEALAKQFQSDAGMGMDDMGREDFAIPFLKIIQALSPEVQKAKPEFIPGVETGDLLNSVSKEVYPGAKGLRVVRVFFEKKFIEWRPRKAGGGLVRISATAEEAARHREPLKGQEFDKDLDTDVIETAQIYCLVETANGWLPAVLPWTKTKLKVSRTWNALHAEQTTSKYGIPGPTRVMPIPGVIYRLATRLETKKGNDFYVPTVQVEGLVDAELYAKALEFRSVVQAGEVKVKYEEPIDEAEDNVPGAMDGVV